MFQAAPFAGVIECVNVNSGMNDPLDLVPVKHDQRVPIAMGNKDEVAKYKSFNPNG